MPKRNFETGAVLRDVFEKQTRGRYRFGRGEWVLAMPEMPKIVRTRVRSLLQLWAVQKKSGVVADAPSHTYRAREWVR
tara:strand:+ start:381 stop:614 length:234 start_codon:yes stop_codon:yes gene_type:complete